MHSSRHCPLHGAPAWLPFYLRQLPPEKHTAAAARAGSSGSAVEGAPPPTAQSQTRRQPPYPAQTAFPAALPLRRSRMPANAAAAPTPGPFPRGSSTPTPPTRAEDDDGDEDDDGRDDDLHLEVLPPHFAPQLPPRLVELVRLRPRAARRSTRKRLAAVPCNACTRAPQPPAACTAAAGPSSAGLPALLSSAARQRAPRPLLSSHLPLAS